MGRPQDSRARAGLLASTLCCAALAVACEPRPPDSAPDLSTSAEAAVLEAALEAMPHAAAPDAVVVRLAFGAAADLDLFVSDPRHETVYFANKRARSGGRLAADLRCDAPAPRIETVRFENALPGRYRIGIDHPVACSDDPAAAVFVVEWPSDGQIQRARGSVAPLVFDSIVQEFDWEAPGSAGRE